MVGTLYSEALQRAIGKAYGRITLYLCKSEDVLCSLQHYYSSESELPELEHVQCMCIVCMCLLCMCLLCMCNVYVSLTSII